MKRFFILSAAFVFFSGWTLQAKADVITGPDLLQNVANQTNSGIEFTALTNSTLQSVLFQNQGGPDTIELASVTVTPQLTSLNQVIGTLSVPAGNPSFLASNLNWSLTAGTTYVLVGTGNLNNGKFAPYNYINNPAADGQIAIISGVFSADLQSVATNPNNWGDFNNITTASTAVPEPGSFFLVVIPAAAGLLRWRALRRQAANVPTGRARLLPGRFA
jgi:hypothetical protein